MLSRIPIRLSITFNNEEGNEEKKDKIIKSYGKGFKCLHQVKEPCLEGQASIAVGCEDLFNRIYVCGSSQVQSQVKAGSGLHDGTS